MFLCYAMSFTGWSNRSNKKLTTCLLNRVPAKQQSFIFPSCYMEWDFYIFRYKTLVYLVVITFFLLWVAIFLKIANFLFLRKYIFWSLHNRFVLWAFFLAPLNCASCAGNPLDLTWIGLLKIVCWNLLLALSYVWIPRPN